MIATDLRFDHLDPIEWRRVQKLFVPQKPTPPLFLLLDGNRVVKAIRPLAAPHAVTADPADFPWRGPASLPSLRTRAGARLALAVDEETALRIADRFDATLKPGDDLVAQLLTGARAARAELGRGLHVDPDLFSSIPVPTYAALQQTFDMLLPDDRSAGLFVFDRSGIYTSIVIEKRRGDLARITSPRALGTEALRVTDFRDGRHRLLLEAMARHSLRPHAALFCTTSAWREIAGPQPGALAQKLALRQAVIDPAPPWLLAFTGAGAAAGVAQTASKLFGRFVPQTVKDVARGTARALSPFTPLGFDPIHLFSELQKLLQ